MPTRGRKGGRGKRGKRRRGAAWNEAVAKALSHSARIGILRTLGEVGQTSPSALAAQASESLPTLAYHMRELRGVGLVRQCGTRPARGAVEHFYELTAEGKAAIRAIDAVLKLEPSAG